MKTTHRLTRAKASPRKLSPAENRIWIDEKGIERATDERAAVCY